MLNAKCLLQSRGYAEISTGLRHVFHGVTLKYLGVTLLFETNSLDCAEYIFSPPLAFPCYRSPASAAVAVGGVRWPDHPILRRHERSMLRLCRASTSSLLNPQKPASFPNRDSAWTNRRRS